MVRSLKVGLEVGAMVEVMVLNESVAVYGTRQKA